MAETEQPTLYITDAAGARWRVWDLRYGPDAGERPHRRSHHPPPDARSNYRAFVRDAETVRIYRFPVDGTRRELDEATLRWQLSQSGYLALERFDADSRTPIRHP